MAEPHFALDLRGESCPYPVMHTLEALDSLQPGQVLEVVTDCLQAFRNLPEETLRRGHRLAAEPVRTGPEMIFLFEVGP